MTLNQSRYFDIPTISKSPRRSVPAPVLNSPKNKSEYEEKSIDLSRFWLTQLLLNMFYWLLDRQHRVVDEVVEVKERNFVYLRVDEHFLVDHLKQDIPCFKIKSNQDKKQQIISSIFYTNRYQHHRNRIFERNQQLIERISHDSHQ